MSTMVDLQKLVILMSLLSQSLRKKQRNRGTVELFQVHTNNTSLVLSFFISFTYSIVSMIQLILDSTTHMLLSHCCSSRYTVAVGLF
jgi:hypothetical protein